MSSDYEICVTNPGPGLSRNAATPTSSTLPRMMVTGLRHPFLPWSLSHSHRIILYSP